MSNTPHDNQIAVTRPPKLGRLSALRMALDEGAVRSAERMINTLHPAEIAQLLESLPPKRRELVWEMTDSELDGDVLVELSEDVRAQLIREMEPEELADAVEGMEVDDLADLLADLPETVTQQLLHNMDQQDRERLSRVLSWPEDTAGGLMSTDTVSVRSDVSIEVVQRYLRMRGELPPRTDRLFAVDRSDRFLGTITLARLLTDDPDNLVGASLDPEAPRIAPDTTASEVSQLFRDRDLVSAPVVDEQGVLLGRITVDDVVDVITEEAAHEVMAGMGGNAGTQTVTLIIRSLALGQVQWRDARWLVMREMGVAALNGMVISVILAAITVAWLGTWKIAVIIAAAMITNLLASAFVGVMVPLTLRRMQVDPALAAGVILTTFTDCIGFATLLGLGTLFLT